MVILVKGLRNCQTGLWKKLLIIAAGSGLGVRLKFINSLYQKRCLDLALNRFLLNIITYNLYFW